MQGPLYVGAFFPEANNAVARPRQLWRRCLKHSLLAHTAGRTQSFAGVARSVSSSSCKVAGRVLRRKEISGASEVRRSDCFTGRRGAPVGGSGSVSHQQIKYRYTETPSVTFGRPHSRPRSHDVLKGSVMSEGTGDRRHKMPTSPWHRLYERDSPRGRRFIDAPRARRRRGDGADQLTGGAAAN